MLAGVPLPFDFDPFAGSLEPVALSGTLSISGFSAAVTACRSQATPHQSRSGASGLRRNLSSGATPCRTAASSPDRSGWRPRVPVGVAARVIAGSNQIASEPQRLSVSLWQGQFPVLYAGVPVCSCRPATTLDSRDESPRAICETEPGQGVISVPEIPGGSAQRDVADFILARRVMRATAFGHCHKQVPVRWALAVRPHPRRGLVGEGSKAGAGFGLGVDDACHHGLGIGRIHRRHVLHMADGRTDGEV